MRKFYTSAFALMLLGGSASAQTTTAGSGHIPAKRQAQNSVLRSHPTATSNVDRVVIWSDDFSVPSTWTTAIEPGAFPLGWQIGVGLENTGSYPTDPIESTTAANGYAMFDSDGGNNPGTLPESATLTTTLPIDLSAYPNVVLEFENQYRRFDPNRCFVVVSTDGTFPVLDDGTDITTMPNVFEVFADVPVNGSSLNPEKISLNISAVAGGASSVFVRFHWTGTWAYTWFVDDVAIVEQPQYDLIMNYSFLSHTGNGEEYGRVPSAQFYPEMNVGAEILNFGVLPQGNVTVDMEVRDDANNVVFTSSQLLGTMNSGDRDTMDQQVTLPALAEGTYKATTVVTSLESSNDGSPDNNTSVRYFAVDNGLYATDLIGVDTNAILNALGSESFTDAEDGLYLLSYYEVRQDMPVAGVELIITSTSTAGAQVIVSLHDTATVNQDDIGSPIVESVSYTVTAADVAAQTVQVLFSGLETLPVGGYYAAALLLSNNNTFPIAVFDDITVPQPGLMGGIHILGDATYSNGNAIAVRAITDPSISVAEQDGLDGVQMYPNPSVDGLVRVVSVLSGISTVEVTNAMGEIVLSDRFTGSTTLNLSGAAKGVYMVRISNEEGSMVQRIVRN